MCKCVIENRLDGTSVAGKYININKKNFKTRRRFRGIFDNTMFLRTSLFIFAFLSCFFNVMCVDDDVLTLQGGIDEKDVDLPSDRRRPVNEQEKDILMLGALGRRKGSYHNGYGSSQEDDSIMDLLGKSEYFKYYIQI